MIARLLRWLYTRKAERIRRETRAAAHRRLPELMAHRIARDAAKRSEASRKGWATRRARAV